MAEPLAERCTTESFSESSYNHPTAISQENEPSPPISNLVTGIKDTAKLFDMIPYTGYKETKTTPEGVDDSKSKDVIPFTVDANYLKELITNLDIKIKIRPILIAFSGLPECGKTKAVRHLLKYYVDHNKLPTTLTPNDYREETAATGMSYFELVACGFQRQRNFSITEVTKDSSNAFSILSAFSALIGKGHIPLFSSENPSASLGDVHLDANLRRIYSYIKERYTQKAPDIAKTDEIEYVKKLMETLPEGIALINVWDLAINKTVLHFLSGLIGHLYNSHMWLFLDIERDLVNLDQPPVIPTQQTQDSQQSASSTKGQDLMRWRPRLHYLLRTSRLSQGAENDTQSKIAKVNPPCTIFAKYSTTQTEEEQQTITENLKKLKEKVKRSAKHINVSSLIDPKIETINLNGVEITDDNSLRLYQKFQQVISETSYEKVPIAWVFLHSLFYHEDSIHFITKRKLMEIASKCGINQESFQRFLKFYTSYGSIFDLSLVDKTYEYVIVKPIAFLRTLDRILNPEDDMFTRDNCILKYGIVSEDTCKELFEQDWRAYMDALVVVNLAARLTGSCIDLPENEPRLDRVKTYYYIPLTRKGDQEIRADTTSLHVITKIDKTHLFKQPFLTSHLLQALPNAKLQSCTISNQTVLHDHTSNVTITIVHHSPTTRIHINEPHQEICSLIVQTCCQIANTSTLGGEYTAFDFIIPCAINTSLTSAHCIASSRYHVLPIDTSDCPKCDKEQKMFNVWNEAIKATQQTDLSSQKPNETNKLSWKDLAKVAQLIAECSPKDGTSHEECLYKIFPIDDSAKKETFKDLESKILHILMKWNENQPHSEAKLTLARNLMKYGQEIGQSVDGESKFGKLVKKLDHYVCLDCFIKRKS